MNIEASQKFFGKRVAHLSKKAGVPWDIGVLVGHIESDEEVLEILCQIKKHEGKEKDKFLYTNNPNQLKEKIGEILGWDLVMKFHCFSVKKIFSLTKFLSGE